MPEFVMNGKDAKEFKALPEMVQGFLEAMFWTNEACESSAKWWKKSTQNRLTEGQLDGDLPNDVGFLELHPDALAKIINYCSDFEVKAHDLLEQAYERDYSESQAGHDLWLTSNGHGSGFWDRNELDADDLGKQLSDLCRYNEMHPYYDEFVYLD